MLQDVGKQHSSSSRTDAIVRVALDLNLPMEQVHAIVTNERFMMAVQGPNTELFGFQSYARSEYFSIP